MESVVATIFTISLLFSNILLIVMAGVGYSYFNSDILLSNYKINLKLLFGFGIGVGILELVGIILFLAVTDFKLNYILTIPVFVLMSILFIVFTRPNYYKKYIDYYNRTWDSNSSKCINFQWTRSCCGYYRFDDRGIPNCPYEFTSGCSSIVSDYLKNHFNEIFFANSTTLCLFAVSIIVLIVYSKVEDVSSILEDVYLIGDIF